MVNGYRKLIALSAALLVGCDDSTKSAAELPPPTFGSASIAGTVHFSGTPPQRRMIDLAGTCTDGPTTIQEETIVVGGSGGLRDSIVYLKDAPPSSGENQPRARLDQSGCQYTPHVLAVQQGQGVTIYSSDRVFHNVHWNSDEDGNGNLGFKPDGGAQVVHFDRPDFIKVRCDVHAWMEAYVGVIANPFFAVTDAEGHFTIDHVPAGKYTLVAWHPLLGERSKMIGVGADGTVAADFDYARPAR